jgi:serine/threonine-protein kinase
VNNFNYQLPLRFGNYNLFDHIGKGGMAEIFLAKTRTGLGVDRLCVIKRILPDLNQDKNFCEMIIKEAKLCANLSHANVVQTFELGQIENQYYIAMEYVEGVDLNRMLGLLSKARKTLPLPFALYIITETLKGLDYAHRRTDDKGNPLNIIHRDVSPTNVLISTQGEVKLCDFGIAKVALDELNCDIQHVDEHHLKGKIAYMSPEHIAGEPIDKRSDLYAAGILLWELLNGRRLFKSKNEDETLQKAKEAVVPPVVDRGFAEFEMLYAIVKKALEKSPDLRFQSGREFIRAIDEYLHITGQHISQLRFSHFLMENYGDELLAQRRSREQNLSKISESEDESSEGNKPKEGEASSTESENVFTRSLLTDFDEDEIKIKEDKEEAKEELRSIKDTDSSSIEKPEEILNRADTNIWNKAFLLKRIKRIPVSVWIAVALGIVGMSAILIYFLKSA